MRAALLDPRILAAGFLDVADDHGIRRMLALFAYGRLCQYEALVASAEESELRRQMAVPTRRGSAAGQSGGQRRGPSLDELTLGARERRALLAEKLPPTAPTDLVLASSLALNDEVKYEVDRADDWANYDEPELGVLVRRIVGAITGVFVDGLGEDERASRRIDQEMLAASAQAGAVLVTQSESLAPEEYEIYQQVAPGSRTPVATL